MPNALKKAFDIYDAKLQAKQSGEKVGNFEIGIRAKLVYTERAKADEVPSEAKTADVQFRFWFHVILAMLNG